MRVAGQVSQRKHLLLLFGLLLFLPAYSSAQARQVRRVLIFNELGPWSPGVSAIDREVYAALMDSPYQIEFYSEDLDSSLFPDEQTQRRFRDWYFQKYRDRKPDLIVAVGPSPIKFMSETHKAFAPGTPIVFWGSTEEYTGPPQLDSDFTGVWGVAQPVQTLDAALRLKPETKHIYVVGGVAPYDRYLEELVRQRFQRYEPKFEVVYLTHLAMPDLLERLKHLPANSIVYHTSIMQDAAGSHFIDATQSVPLIAAAANAPVFAVDDVDVGRGTVGGDVFSFTIAGRVAAAMCIRILNGEKPRDIPIVRGANTFLFDWRELKRWGIDERALPPGSVVLNRQPTLWESYRWYVIIGVALILAQSALISGLMWQRARRRTVEAELETTLKAVQESERRFRLVTNTAPVMIWMSGKERVRTFFNQFWLDFTGRPVSAEIGDGWLEGVHPDDRRICIEMDAEGGCRWEPFRKQYRLRRNDGQFRWILDCGVPRLDDTGALIGYIGSAIDVTEQREAAEALSTISRRLVEAQEAERTRIARELHDNINQRLALIAITLQSILRPAVPGPELENGINEAVQNIVSLSNDIQALSHRLHSSALEYLGLKSASAGLCREISRRHKVHVDFHSDGLPDSLPPDVSLGLYRVLQEAMQNALKHSSANRMAVSLTGESGSIRLLVRDFGNGFDLADRGKGLGIISMRERLRLVGGSLSIETTIQGGTSVIATVPFSMAVESTG